MRPSLSLFSGLILQLTRCAPMLACAAALAFAPLTGAQCTPQWLPGDGVFGPDPHVYAATNWDPDGLGPLPTYVVVGGSFNAAGTVFTSAIAMFANSNWFSPATGVSPDGTVRALAACSGENLFVAGTFTSAGGVQTANIARYDGTSWWPLGSGIDGDVNALLLLAGGDLIAAGNFTSAGGIPCSNIARWSPTLRAWSPLATGTSAPVYSLAQLPGGDIVAGGIFFSAGGSAASNIARFDGTNWNPLGAGTNLGVRSLLATPSGDLIAGGLFTTAGGTPAAHVARWNGSAWSAMGAELNDSVEAFYIMPSGDLIAGGFFLDPSRLIRRIARWNGTSWDAYGSGTLAPVRALALLGTTTLIAGGEFTSGYIGNSTTPLNFVAGWTGTTWNSLTTATTSNITALKALSNGDMLVGGNFTSIGGVSARKIARWNGSSGGGWSAFGTGMPSVGLSGVRCIAVGPGGATSDIVVGGDFAPSTLTTISRIARWNGTTWTDLAGGMTLDENTGETAIVSVVCFMPGGDLIAGGRFDTAGGVPAANIARWNGTAWSPLGTGTDAEVRALAVLPNGDLVAGGSFTTAGGVNAGYVARWTGSAWSPMGLGTGQYVLALALTPAGELISGGGIWPNSVVARWNGSSWDSLGSPAPRPVTALDISPTGEITAAGGFNFGVGGSSAVERLIDSRWTSLGFGASDYVYALASFPTGELWAGGSFNTFDQRSTRKLARWVSPRPPVIVSSPAPATVCAVGNTSFSVSAAPSTTAPMSYRWELRDTTSDWLALTGLPTSLACGGSASASPHGSPTTTISLTACATAATFQVRCVVTNSCGSTTTTPATLSVCRADFNCSGTPNLQDIFDFLAAFFAQSPSADINASGAATIQDIFDFLTLWFAGC